MKDYRGNQAGVFKHGNEMLNGRTRAVPIITSFESKASDEWGSQLDWWKCFDSCKIHGKEACPWLEGSKNPSEKGQNSIELTIHLRCKQTVKVRLDCSFK